jgi:hypothetical protein
MLTCDLRLDWCAERPRDDPHSFSERIGTLGFQGMNLSVRSARVLDGGRDHRASRTTTRPRCISCDRCGIREGSVGSDDRLLHALTCCPSSHRFAYRPSTVRVWPRDGRMAKGDFRPKASCNACGDGEDAARLTECFSDLLGCESPVHGPRARVAASTLSTSSPDCPVSRLKPKAPLSRAGCADRR